MRSARALAVTLGVFYLACWGCSQGAGGGRGEIAPHPEQAGAEASAIVTAQPSAEVPQVQQTLELTGSGLRKPTVFTFEQLAAMDFSRLDEVLMLRTHGDDMMTSWRGPSLDSLFEAAGVVDGPLSITLAAKDSYEISANRDDLRDAVVALQDGEGRWLVEKDPRCPVRFVPPRVPGDYWLMNLAIITVEPAAGQK